MSQLYAPDCSHVAGIALANGFRTVIPLAFARTLLPVASHDHHGFRGMQSSPTVFAFSRR